MESVFLKVVNMSINATWLIAVVALLRLILSKAPKQLRCILWGLVALRLLLPFSIESMFSLVPSAKTLPDNILYTASPVIDSGIPMVDNAVNPILSHSMAPEPLTSANPTQIWSFIFSQLWILGMVVMALYALLSWLHVKRKVTASLPMGKDIRLCDYIDSPFILGLVHPVIYLPSCLEESSLSYVMAHERSHLKRRDHWWKPLGFAILTVHWFNPAVWVAYCLLCRDIELACDERVIQELGESEKTAYSNALLSCSIRRPYIAACPLAFGEVGVKQRIHSVLNYRKPGFRILLVSLMVCAVLALCFLTDPVVEEYELEGTTIRYETDDTGRITFLSHQEEDVVYTLLGSTTYPHGAVSSPYRLFPNGEIRDADNQVVNIQYFLVTGLQRETETRLIDTWRYNMSSRSFTMDSGSDSLEKLNLCSFPDIPQDNNLAALAGLGDEEISAISLSSRIGVIALASKESMEAFAAFLSGFRYDPTPLSDTAVSQDQPIGGTVTPVAPVNRNSAFLEEYLCFSQDFSTVWTWSDGNQGLPYRVENPEGLEEYFTRITTPVRNTEVTADHFATREEPYKWLQHIHAGALTEVYVSHRGVLAGRLSAEYYDQLEPVLRSIPEDALTLREDPVVFSEALHGNDILSLDFYDGANNILVQLHWGSKELLLVTYPGADIHSPNSPLFTQGALIWQIDSPELAQLMAEFNQQDISVTLFATREDYIHYGPSQVFFGNSLGAQSVTLTIPKGWVADRYHESTVSPETIFQLMPEGVENGSIRFQLYEKGTFAVDGLGCEQKPVQVGLYPATGYYYDGNEQWTYLHIPGRVCDLVIVNEAWDWIGEYADQIMEILATLNTPECMASEAEIQAIGAYRSDRPKYNTLRVVQKSDGTWAIRYYDADRKLIGELLTDIWGNPL